ncbi:MAG: ATP-binding protein [Ignavibacteriae bacterium]|nr:ATP-binding protein [Ignavibacteriota bacterium]
MAIKIKISPMLLKSVATLYSDPHRVLMEYIDNAVDAAEIFYDKASQQYTKQIEIIITLDGKSHDYARVTIHDNCTGINNLSDLVTNVGNSSKLYDQDTNGQFGFGIYSFLAICNSLIITTRLSNSSTINRVELNSKMFETPDTEGLEIEEKENIASYKLEQAKEDCWTIFKLEDFHKQAFREISIKTLKTEIENHFELILSRKNIIIKIIDTSKKEYICNSFDYNKHDGDIFYRELYNLEKTKSKKLKTKVLISIPTKLIINLKVYKNRMLGRKPVFIIKGRRITEISNVKAFRTTSKNSIWSHPNITGYIDVSGILEPNISRDDFRANTLAKALFQTLAEMESEIKEFIIGQLKFTGSNEFKDLEDILSQAFNKLSSNNNFRNLFNFNSDNNNKYLRNKDKEIISLLAPKKVDSINGTSAGSDGNTPNLDINSPGNEMPGDDLGNDNKVSTTNKETILKDVKVKITNTDNSPAKSFKQKKNNFGGINIVIDCENEPPLDINEKELRSSMINNQIIIYQKHAMFEDRIKTGAIGTQTISNELVFYISIEIMTQIKIFVFTENKKSIEDIGAFFNNFNEVIYLFIKDLAKLTGKNLSELTNLKRV